MSTQNIPVYNQYLGNGVAKEFSIGFPYLKKDYVKVYLLRKDRTQELLDSSRYKYVNDKVIEFPILSSDAVLAEGDVLTIQRETTLGSNYEFDNQRRLFPEQVMDADDLSFQQIQELARDISRAVKTSPTDTITGDELLREFNQKVVEVKDAAISSEQSATESASSANNAAQSASEAKVQADRAQGISDAFDANATAKTQEYNDNAQNKLNAYKENAIVKTQTFNQNATQKTIDYNANASAKTQAFNTNAAQKQAAVDASAAAAEQAKEYAEAAITDANLITVATDLKATPSNIKTTAGSIDNVNKVGNNIDKVVAVAGNETNINAVNANKANVDIVAGSITNVNDVAMSKEDIAIVSQNVSDVMQVADNIADVNNVSSNIADVKAAVQSAADALESKNEAKIWAVGTLPERPEGSAKYWAEQAQSVVQIDDATETKKGIVRLSTEEEAKQGFDDSTAITPLKMTKVIYDNVGRGIQLGFNGTLEGNLLTFETSDSEPYTLRHNYDYEIDLLFPAVGVLPDDVEIVIKNGTETINIVNVLHDDYTKHITVGDMKQIMKYTEVVGWRWIFQARYVIAPDSSRVFVMPSTVVNVGPDVANITNCITKIPQDIKLELNDGTLTLKAGSKVYVPNGVGNFDTVAIQNNISVSSLGSTSGESFIYFNTENNKITASLIIGAYSGTTEDDSKNYWYDTANNIIKGKTSRGFIGKYSFPLAVITRDNNTITSIDQVFNGFGYIGSTVFALPGVEGLIPNGRNEDGSPKSIEFTTTSVSTFTIPDARDCYLCCDLNENLAIPKISEIKYDKQRNYLLFNGTIYKAYIGVRLSSDSSGRITSFTPKSVFQALDYNDKSTISGWGMPSDKYIDLTLSTSGSSYIAPANGWFMLNKVSGISNNQSYIVLVNRKTNIKSQTVVYNYSSSILSAYLPIQKGDAVEILYNGTGEVKEFRFIYAEGEN